MDKKSRLYITKRFVITAGSYIFHGVEYQGSYWDFSMRASLDYAARNRGTDWNLLMSGRLLGDDEQCSEWARFQDKC